MMYIKKIQINSFGCITDKIYTFSKGFNFIFGKNESGKSTLFAFIVFLFYGTKVKKSPGSLSFKEKYMPWNGKPMQGKIIFEHNEKNYELSRLVSSSESTVSLFCIDTGEQIRDRQVLISPGEYFFGVGVQAFFNTAFIPETSTDYMSTEEIIAKLTSISTNSDNEVSYNNILDIIDNEISQLSSDRRKSAIIPELTEKLSEKRKKSNYLQEISNQSSTLKAEIDDIRDNISKTEEEISYLKSQMPNSIKKGKDKISGRWILPSWIFALVFNIFLFFFVNPIISTAVFIALISLLVVLLVFVKKRSKNENDIKLFTLQQNNDKIILLTERLSDMRLEYQLKQRTLEDATNALDDYDAILDDEHILENDLRKAIVRLDALKIARLAIVNAYSEYRASFSPKLAEITGRILKSITDSKYNTTAIDDELRLSVDSPFGYKTADSFSRGSIQQAEFAKRLALCEVVFDRKIPVFLDDAFAFFDENRLENALNYLINISSSTQIFFSSCRRAELDLISEKGINILLFD